MLKLTFMALPTLSDIQSHPTTHFKDYRRMFETQST